MLVAGRHLPASTRILREDVIRRLHITWPLLGEAISFCSPKPPFEISDLVSKLAAAYPNTRHPREQILLQRLASGDGKAGKMEFLFDVSNHSPFVESQPSKRYGTMMQMLQYPFSVGSIHIPPVLLEDTTPHLMINLYRPEVLCRAWRTHRLSQHGCRTEIWAQKSARRRHWRTLSWARFPTGAVQRERRLRLGSVELGP
ncbi:hypothetical protein GJ744_009593 [Endocarpon pusillum]|uniref:Uncharacterized protein n=1 Tax=Endocarpon pusillum TaxID=364733 RepID=A0A8H7E3N0_9EURO|nr:hypothetical protein GJ744_009593 [Endocarpon pusillum]